MEVCCQQRRVHRSHSHCSNTSVTVQMCDDLLTVQDAATGCNPEAVPLWSRLIQTQILNGILRRLPFNLVQMYYQLSRMRQARRIRDIVLVRLEQLCPFPHDLITRVRLLFNVEIMCITVHYRYVHHSAAAGFLPTRLSPG